MSFFVNLLLFATLLKTKTISANLYREPKNLGLFFVFMSLEQVFQLIFVAGLILWHLHREYPGLTHVLRFRFTTVLRVAQLFTKPELASSSVNNFNLTLRYGAIT